MRVKFVGCALVLLLALTACATGGGERQQRISEALQQLTTDTDYAATERCLSSFD